MVYGITTFLRSLAGGYVVNKLHILRFEKITALAIGFFFVAVEEKSSCSSTTFKVLKISRYIILKCSLSLSCYDDRETPSPVFQLFVKSLSLETRV